MIIDIFTRTPNRLIEKIMDPCTKAPTVNGDWQVIEHEKKQYLTLADDDHYFKMFIEFEVYFELKLRANILCLYNDLPDDKVMAKYSGKLVEYLVENFSGSFRGIQVSM